MAKIEIDNLFNKVLVVTDLSKTLLQHFHDHRVDWMQSCGGKGRCTTCKVIIRSGSRHFSQLTEAEQKYIDQRALARGERLSCQVRIGGDVVISAPSVYKLPHVKYSDDQSD